MSVLTGSIIGTAVAGTAAGLAGADFSFIPEVVQDAVQNTGEAIVNNTPLSNSALQEKLGDKLATYTGIAAFAAGGALAGGLAGIIYDRLSTTKDGDNVVPETLTNIAEHGINSVKGIT